MAEKKRAKSDKATRGRMPTKRSINLIVVDKNKINPLKAIPLVLVVIVAAVLFSKFMVLDRLNAVSEAEAKAARLQSDLDTVNDKLNSFGEIEDTYAHYTIDGMTAAELGRVDRTQILQLVVNTLPVIPPQHTEAHVNRFLNSLFRPMPNTRNGALNSARAAWRESLKSQLIPPPEYTVKNWRVQENILTLQVTGRTLERLNQLARQIEKDPIVNRCTISTANMQQNRAVGEDVQANIIVYLQAAQKDASTEEVAKS